VKSSLAILDPHELPRYTLPEVARYLRMSKDTLKTWVAGRSYPVAGGEKRWEGLLQRPNPADPKLSFLNLIEAHVLLALRKQYQVKMREVRTALEYAREELGVERILLSPELRVMKGNLFLQRLNELINVGRGGQGAFPGILEAYLDRIEWGGTGLPVRIFPLTRADHLQTPKILAIDPRIAFGRPVVERTAVKTSVIAERFKAGESLIDLAEDYDLEVFEVEEAIRYEALPDAA
jgi:uncharacterized protein (DUF433 family)